MGWPRRVEPGGGPVENVKNAIGVRGSGDPTVGVTAASIGGLELEEGVASEIVAAGAASGNSEQWHAQGSGSGEEVGWACSAECSSACSSACPTA